MPIPASHQFQAVNLVDAMYDGQVTWCMGYGHPTRMNRILQSVYI